MPFLQYKKRAAAPKPAAARRELPAPEEVDDQPDRDGARNTQAREWMFTWNNPDPDWKTVLQAIYDGVPGIDAIWGGFERAPRTGTPHIQGGIACKVGKRFNTVRNIFLGHEAVVHLTVAKNDPEKGWDMAARIAYCSKGEGTPSEPRNADFIIVPNDFKPKVAGRRIDYAAAIEAVRKGDSVRDIVEKQPQLLPMIRPLQALEKLQITAEFPNESRQVIYIWGVSGSGKSTAAVNWCKAKKLSYHVHRGNHPWYDGYNDEAVLIMDDFEPAERGRGLLTARDLIAVMDGTCANLPIKGAHVRARHQAVIVTSNFSPQQLFEPLLESPTPLVRRIQVLVEAQQVHPLAQMEPRYVQLGALEGVEPDYVPADWARRVGERVPEDDAGPAPAPPPALLADDSDGDEPSSSDDDDAISVSSDDGPDSDEDSLDHVQVQAVRTAAQQAKNRAAAFRQAPEPSQDLTAPLTPPRASLRHEEYEHPERYELGKRRPTKPLPARQAFKLVRHHANAPASRPPRGDSDSDDAEH